MIDTREGVSMGTLTEIAGEPHTQGFTPGLGVDGKPKPYFANGTSVYYELAPGVNGYGFIRYYSPPHLLEESGQVDRWLDR